MFLFLSLEFTNDLPDHLGMLFDLFEYFLWSQEVPIRLNVLIDLLDLLWGHLQVQIDYNIGANLYIFYIINYLIHSFGYLTHFSQVLLKIYFCNFLFQLYL